MAEYYYKLLHVLGPEAPILFFVWLLYMVSLWPLALMNQVKLAIFASPMCFGLGITFIAFSVGRGTSWLIFSCVCLLASIAGTVHGLYLRMSHPVLVAYLPLNYPALLLQAVFIPGGILLLVLSVIAPIISTCGCGIVGTTQEYRKKMADNMIFGTAVQENLELAAIDVFGAFEKQTSLEDRLQEEMLIKLQSDLYYSGEPIYDYAFWLANNHIFLGIFFHHPLSPLGTGHRFVIMILTSLLIVFPVALVSVLWVKFVPSFVILQGLFRLIFMAFLVTIPRNILKARMKRIAIETEKMYIDMSVYIDMRYSNESKPDVRKIKNDLIRKEALFFGGICLTTLFFCCLTWCLVSDEHPLVLLLSNTDGLGFCFVLEILFPLVLPRKSKTEEWCLGWWGRWHSERLWHSAVTATFGKSKRITQGIERTEEIDRLLKPMPMTGI